MRIPKVYYFKNEKEKEKHTIKNGSVKEVPYAYFRYKKMVWPIYNDDYGQQNYIVVNNHIVGGGAYNFCDILVFIDAIEYFLNKENK